MYQYRKIALQRRADARWNIQSLVIALLLLLQSSAFAMSVPQLITYQGRLVDGAGDPLPNGSYKVAFKLFDAVIDGNLVWGQSNSVPVVDGRFSVALGSGDPIDGAGVNELRYAFGSPERFLQIEVLSEADGTPKPEPQVLLPRQQMGSVPFAMQADHAAVSALGETIPGALATSLVNQGRDAGRVRLYTQVLSGSGTWNVPPWLTSNQVLVFGLGGGGGGGSGAMGRYLGQHSHGGTGGSGAIGRFEHMTVTIGGTVSYSAGSGGAGGASRSTASSPLNGNNGAAGGNTTFGSLTFLGGGLGAGGTYTGSSSPLSATASVGPVEGGAGSTTTGSGQPGKRGARGAGAVGGNSRTDNNMIRSGGGGGGGGYRGSGSAGAGGDGGNGATSGNTLADRTGGNGASGTGAGGGGGGGGMANISGSNASSGPGGNGGSGYLAVYYWGPVITP